MSLLYYDLRPPRANLLIINIQQEPITLMYTHNNIVVCFIRIYYYIRLIAISRGTHVRVQKKKYNNIPN